MTHSPSYTYTITYLIMLIAALQKGISTYMYVYQQCTRVLLPLTISSSSLVIEILAHFLGKILHYI